MCLNGGVFGAVLDGVGQQGAHEGVDQCAVAGDQGLTSIVLEYRVDVLFQGQGCHIGNALLNDGRQVVVFRREIGTGVDAVEQ